MQGDGATFNLDKADPVGYGVYIPAPNMYTTMSISGSNQGEFVAMNWLGVPQQTETVNFPGDDISLIYPQYFENYMIDSTTNNDYINPWSVEWLNVSANNAESDTLSPFNLNSVFNYYVMAEGSELVAPINNSMSMQIDIMIDNTGPKILKLDWLLDNPDADPLDSINLISPSGKIVNMVPPIPAQEAWGATIVFYYITFVAHESGTYRLLLSASYPANPGYLNLKFLDLNLNDLVVDKVSFAGDGDEWPSFQDFFDDEWNAEWFRIKGNKGDKFSLDYGYDYSLSTPLVSIFYPSEYEYTMSIGIAPGTHDIYFPKTGYAYISLTDIAATGPYLASFYLKEIPVLEYNIGDEITNIRVSRDQRKAIDFTIEQDSFVRFNYTEWGDGNARVSSMGTSNGFIFKDAKKLSGYEVLTPIETKSAGTMNFYYYYFPAGEYEAIIKNGNPLYDSVLQISSEYVYSANATIPITSLSYPLTNPTSSLTAQFEPDGFYSSLKQGQWFDINIAETGQYRFNWSIYASDNTAQVPTSANPSVVLVYNDTTEEYYDYTTRSHTYLQSFPALDTTSDYLYIAYPSKWHDMHFNISQLGTAGGVDSGVDVWTGSIWEELARTSDTTGEFQTANGTWVLNIYGDADFNDWTKGVGTTFDRIGIDEEKYYWLRFDCDNAYSTIPYIDLISLSNITMRGDVNFALVMDSGYEYSDFRTPTAPPSITDITINQESGNDIFSYEQWLFGATSDPKIIGLEAGTYKLLVIPEQWSHPGSLSVRFAIEDYWGYHVEQSYTIDQNPVAHSRQIGNMVNVGGSILYNYSTYPYDFSITYNDTEVSWDDYTAYYEGYIAINCQGTPYSWTQLVVGGVNVSDYELYILQDLPWINNNGPNFEQRMIAGTIGDNNTIEFGVISSNFTLLFEINGDGSPNEMVTLNIGLRQYNTTALYTSEIAATYTPPGADMGPLILTLLIVIPAGAGAVVVVYVLKKKGKILTKHPT